MGCALPRKSAASTAEDVGHGTLQPCPKLHNLVPCRIWDAAAVIFKCDVDTVLRQYGRYFIQHAADMVGAREVLTCGVWPAYTHRLWRSPVQASRCAHTAIAPGTAHRLMEAVMQGTLTWCLPPVSGFQGYSKLLDNFSTSFAGFLTNLNNLHLQLSLGMPTLVTPDFRVEKVISLPLWVD